MAGFTYDAGALISAERGDGCLLELHERALRQGIAPTIPAGVLAQVWRGGPQAQLSRLLAGCSVEELSEDQARLAGAACAASSTSDVIDATVIVSAASRGDRVITSDPGDLQLLADALGAPVTIVAL